MSTFLLDFTEALNSNWEEIDVLLDTAEPVKDSNISLYNVLCRSATVLMIAHFEGFTKDLIKSLIRDINDNCVFSEIPIAIKRTYCKKYIGNNVDKSDKKYNEKINKLIEKFNDIGGDISYEPFLFPVNKNPNAYILNTIFKNAGIDNIFSCLHESDLEQVFFSDSINDLNSNLESIKLAVKNIVSSYPYCIEDEKYGLNKKSCPNNTIWEVFIEEINKKRHAIAHGNEFNNSDDINELKKRKIKIMLLQQLLILIIVHKLSINAQ